MDKWFAANDIKALPVVNGWHMDGARYFVHTTAKVCAEAKVCAGACVGEGSQIGARSRIGEQAWVGNFATVGDFATVGKGAWVGKGALVPAVIARFVMNPADFGVIRIGCETRTTQEWLAEGLQIAAFYEELKWYERVALPLIGWLDAQSRECFVDASPTKKEYGEE